MNRVIIIAAASLMLVAGCGQSAKQTIADYTAKSESFAIQYKENVQKIQSDSTLTDAQKGTMLEELYEKTVSEMTSEAVKVIKNNPADSVALVALRDVASMLEPDELESTLNLIKGDIAEDELVVKLKDRVQAKKNTAEGQMFTDFEVVQDESDPEGSTVKFSDYVGKGKYVLVDFWASWCGPCKREIPNIAAVYDKYKGDDFDVLSVAVWDKPEDTKAAAVEHGVVWSQIINAQRIPTDIYGIEGIPHIMLVAPDGKIVARNLRGEAIEEAVAKALGH